MGAEPDLGAPLISGDDWMMRIFLGGQKFGEDLIVSANVKPNTTKYRDAHGGSKVLKVDMRIWGWDIDVRTNYKTDRLLRAMMAYYQSLMTPGAVPVSMSILLAIQERDVAAKKPGYLFSPCIADYDLSMSSQQERLKQGLTCWAQTWKPFSAK